MTWEYSNRLETFHYVPREARRSPYYAHSWMWSPKAYIPRFYPTMGCRPKCKKVKKRKRHWYLDVDGYLDSDEAIGGPRGPRRFRRRGRPKPRGWIT